MYGSLACAYTVHLSYVEAFGIAHPWAHLFKAVSLVVGQQLTNKRPKSAGLCTEVNAGPRTNNSCSVMINYWQIAVHFYSPSLTILISTNNNAKKKLQKMTALSCN